MVRATSRAPSVGQSNASKIRSRRKKAYKVQVESVVTKKKKLKLLHVQGSTKPAPGYTFLPVGHADLAERCKEKSRQLGVDVSVVSAGKSRGDYSAPHKLTHHVHRVGYHFRSDIFDQACNLLGYRETNGKLIRDTGFDATSRFETTVASFAPTGNLTADNQGIKVKQYIRELFPKIPEHDLQEIYNRAWEMGTSTVGNAADLSLPRQVQLATIARIRHVYTDYDKLLRLVSWTEARSIVEPMSLTKLLEWRGEHDNDGDGFEEILRETIVIDDDDDDEAEDAESDVESHGYVSGDSGSETSLEISQQTLAPKDLNIAAGEKTKPAHGVFGLPSAVRAVGRTLPAAIQNRWQDARLRQRAADQASTLPGHSGQGGQISVPLDQRGNLPKKVVSGGVEYIRISSSPETRPEQRPQAMLSASEYQQMPSAQTSHPGHGYAHLRDAQNMPAGRLQSDVPLWDRPDRRLMHLAPSKQVIDLTSSPEMRGGYRDKVSYAGPSEFGFRPGEPSAHSTAPGELAHRSVYRLGTAGHRLYEYASNQERVETIKPEDRPILSREAPQPDFRSLRPQLGEAKRREVSLRHFGQPVHTRIVQHRPVFGQPAYPQMRSQNLAMQVVTRPVHGAPAAVQPMPYDRRPSAGQAAPPNFGAPSPQRHLMGSSDRPYYIPDR